jgi:dTDP-4-amino-4,6-dideoxygalactose transaminase
VVRTLQREAFRAFLLECGIATDVHYPIADIRQPVFGGRFNGQLLEVTEAACATALSLPCFPGMPEANVAHVVRSVLSFFSRSGA